MQMVLARVDNLLTTIQSDVGSYWTGLTNAISASSEMLANASNTSAAQYEAFARQMLDLAKDYSQGLMNTANNAVTLTPAERAMLQDMGSDLVQKIEQIRQSGSEALVKHGRDVANAARETTRGMLAEAGGALYDAANLTNEVFKSVDSGNWFDVGKTAAGIGAAGIVGAYAPAALAAGAAMLGIVGFPAAVLVFAGTAFLAWAADKYGGKLIFSGWDEIRKLIEGMFDDFTDAQDARSPLVLDLDGDGVETLGHSADVYFDHDGNGFAERTGWAGKDDGLLVWDKIANGQIDTGAELFGNGSTLANGQKAANGFAALADLDANGDGVVNSLDTGFSNLRVWKDADSDGRVDEGELLTLAQASVASLNVSYATSTLTDGNGNQHRQVGGYTKTDGSIAAMDDVWFATAPAYSLDTQRVAEPADLAALPDVQGFGNVESLRQAMTKDASGQLVQCAALFCTYPPLPTSAALARVTLARMSVAEAVQMKGLGCAL